MGGEIPLLLADKTMNTEMLKEARRALDGIIMKEIDDIKNRNIILDGKIDRMGESVHNIDKSVSEIKVLFENQVPQCSARFDEITRKHNETRGIVVSNKDNFKSFVDKLEGSKNVFGFVRKYMFPIFVGIGGLIISYLKGRGVI